MDVIVSVSELTKEYRKKTVIDHVSFSVTKGEILGIAGPEDSGKTTLLKMLAHLISPSFGEVLYDGMREDEDHHFPVGALIDSPKLVENFTVYDNMYVQCAYVKVNEPKKHSMTLLKMFHLKEVSKKTVSKLSSDEKKRLGIALAMIGYPPVLLLDDPFKDLSSKSISLVNDVLLEYRDKKQSTILIGSETMTPLQNLADRILVLSEGKILKELKAEEIEEVSFSKICIKAEPEDQVMSILEPYHASLEDGIIYISYKGDEFLKFINHLLYDHNVRVIGVTVEQERTENTYPALQDTQKDLLYIETDSGQIESEVINPQDVVVENEDDESQDLPEEETEDDDGIFGFRFPSKDSFKTRVPSFRGKYEDKNKQEKSE